MRRLLEVVVAFAVVLCTAKAQDATKLLGTLDTLINNARGSAHEEQRKFSRSDLLSVDKLAQKVHRQCDEISRLNTAGEAWEPPKISGADGNPIRAALAFFGVMRSLSSTICNIRARILRPLESAGVEFETFVHTFNVQSVNNARNVELNQTLLLGEWRLLPNLYGAVVSSQEQYLSDDDTEQLEKYLPNTYDSNASKYAWGDEKTAASLRNLLRQYYSLSNVTSLWKERHRENPFDVVFFLRPDVAYLETMNPEILRSLVSIQKERRTEVWASPTWSSGKGRNDRMAFGTPFAMERYGTRLERAENYVRDTGEALHAEKFLFFDMRAGDVRFRRNFQGKRRSKAQAMPERYAKLAMRKSPVEERFFKLRFMRIRSGCVRNDKRCKCNSEGKCGPFTGPLMRSNWTVDNRDCKGFAAESPQISGAPASWLFLPPFEAPRELLETEGFSPSPVNIDETDSGGRGGLLCSDSWVAGVTEAIDGEKEKEIDKMCPTFDAAIGDIYPTLRGPESSRTKLGKADSMAFEFGGRISKINDRTKVFHAAMNPDMQCPFDLSGSDGLSEACTLAREATRQCKVVVFSQAFEIEDIEHVQRPRSASGFKHDKEEICWILFVLDRYRRTGDSSYSPKLLNLLEYLSKQGSFGTPFVQAGKNLFLGPWQLIAVKSSALPYSKEREQPRTYVGNPSFRGNPYSMIPGKDDMPWYIQHEIGINAAAIKHLASGSCFAHAEFTVWVHPRLTLTMNPLTLAKDLTLNGRSCMGAMEMNTKVVKGSLENLVWKLAGFLDEGGKPQREFQALELQQQTYAKELFRDQATYDPWLLKVTDDNAFNQHSGEQTRNLNLTDSGLLVTSNSRTCGSYVRRVSCTLFGESHCFGVHDFLAIPIMMKSLSSSWRGALEKLGIEQLVHVEPYLEEGTVHRSLLHWDISRPPRAVSENARVAIRREFVSGVCPAFRSENLKSPTDPQVSFGCGVYHRQEKLTSFIDAAEYEQEIDTIRSRCSSCAELSLERIRKASEKFKGSCSNVVFTALFYPGSAISNLVKKWSNVRQPAERMSEGAEPPSTCYIAAIRSSYIGILEKTTGLKSLSKAGTWNILEVDDNLLPYKAMHDGENKGDQRLLRLFPAVAHRIFPWANAVVYVNTLKGTDSGLADLRSYEEAYNGDRFWQKVIEEVRGSGACLGLVLVDRLKLRPEDLETTPEVQSMKSSTVDRLTKMQIIKYLYPEFSHELLTRGWHSHLYSALSLDGVPPRSMINKDAPVQSDVNKFNQADEAWSWFMGMYDEIFVTLGATSSRCEDYTAAFSCALFQESHCVDGPFGLSLHHALRATLGVPLNEQELPVLVDLKHRPSVLLFPRHRMKGRILGEHVDDTDAIDLRRAGLYDQVIRLLRLPEKGDESLLRYLQNSKPCLKRMKEFQEKAGLVWPQKLTDLLLCVDTWRLELEAESRRTLQRDESTNWPLSREWELT